MVPIPPLNVERSRDGAGRLLAHTAKRKRALDLTAINKLPEL